MKYFFIQVPGTTTTTGVTVTHIQLTDDMWYFFTAENPPSLTVNLLGVQKVWPYFRILPQNPAIEISFNQKLTVFSLGYKWKCCGLLSPNGHI